MASGNQVCRPICADFPIAPIKRKKHIKSIFFTKNHKKKTFSLRIKVTRLKTKRKFKVLKYKKIRIIAKRKKTSAILFISIAFTAAFIAKTLVYQKLINKNEQTPTPSQPIKSCKKLSAVTKTNIKNVNKDKKPKNLVMCGSCSI